MAYPSSIDAPDTTMQGGSLLATNDHAADHRLLGSAVINIENKLGIGSGSAGVNQILVGQGAGTATWGTVWNNATLGTPTLTGGSANSLFLGTPTIQAWDEWEPVQTNTPGTLTYLATDGHIFTATTNVDFTGLIGQGDRIKCTNQAATQNFLVHAINSGTVTLYGGTAYSLTNTAITSPYFSHAKVPFGFNPDPAVWTESLSDTTSPAQNSPGIGTWYNFLSLSVPIGKWRIYYNVPGAANLAGNNCGLKLTLSTGTASETDTDLSSTGWSYNSFTAQFHREKNLSLAAKTIYYLNASPIFSSQTNIQLRGDITPSKIVATSAYL